MDGLFFCPECGTRLDAPAPVPSRGYEAPLAEGHAPTIPSQKPPPPEASQPSMLDDTTRAYGRDGAAPAKVLPERARLRSLVLHPTIAPHVARIASAVRARRLSVGIVVEIAVLVACADNDVDEDEYAALEDVVSAALGDIDRGLVSGVVDAAIAKLRASSFEARTREVGRSVAVAGAIDEALVLAFALAFASGDLSIAERGVIDALAETMNARVGALAHARSIVRHVIDASFGP
jgi:tellurite resistance protein